jgi:hypothetical protein
MLVLTLVPTSGPGPSGFQWHLFTGEFDLSDIINNLLLFIPLAAALRCAGVQGRTVVAIGIALSVTIEFVQLRVLAGRDASLSDLLANTVGAGAGVWLARWLPVRRRSAFRGVGVALACVIVLAGDGVLERTAFPGSHYYGQWTANLGMYDWYRGTVLGAELAGMPLPSWRLHDSRTIRRELLVGAPLAVRAIAGPAPGKLAPLFSIFDNEQREILLVGPDRNDLVLHVRSHAGDVRLRPTELRWPGVLAGVRPGDSLAVTVRRAPSGYCLAVNGRERCGLAHTAGEAWSLLQSLPGLAPRAQAVLAFLTMFLLGLPVGLVTARKRWGWAGPALLCGGAIVVPLLVGLAPTPPLQLAALALGIVAGTLAP